MRRKLDNYNDFQASTTCDICEQPTESTIMLKGVCACVECTGRALVEKMRREIKREGARR